MFLSTFMMKMDKKGRISVPAPWRAHLSEEGFDGFIAFPSISHDAIDARGAKAFNALMDKLQADTQAKAGTFEAETEQDAIKQARFEIASTGTMGFAHTAGEFGDYDAQLIEEGVQP